MDPNDVSGADVINLDAARAAKNNRSLGRRRAARAVSDLGWPVAGGAILAASGYGMAAPVVLAVGAPLLASVSMGRRIPPERAIINGIALLAAYRLIEGRMKRPWYKK